MKYKLLHNIPELSAQEIEQKKDFNLLLQKRNELITKRLFFKKVILSVIISLTILALLFLLFQYLRNTYSRQKEISLAPIAAVIPEENTFDKAKKLVKTPKPTFRVQSEDQEARREQKEQKDSALANLSIQNMTAFEQAYPLVGMDSLQRYLHSNIKHPASNAVNDSLQDGKVTVYFTIDTLGKPTEIYSETMMEKVFEIEAMRLIREMPTWQPAMVNGNAVPSKLKISVAFKGSKP